MCKREYCRNYCWAHSSCPHDRANDCERYVEIKKIPYDSRPKKPLDIRYDPKLRVVAGTKSGRKVGGTLMVSTPTGTDVPSWLNQPMTKVRNAEQDIAETIMNAIADAARIPRHLLNNPLKRNTKWKTLKR